MFFFCFFFSPISAAVSQPPLPSYLTRLTEQAQTLGKKQCINHKPFQGDCSAGTKGERWLRTGPNDKRLEYRHPDLQCSGHSRPTRTIHLACSSARSWSCLQLPTGTILPMVHICNPAQIKAELPKQAARRKPPQMDFIWTSVCFASALTEAEGQLHLHLLGAARDLKVQLRTGQRYIYGQAWYGSPVEASGSITPRPTRLKIETH